MTKTITPDDIIRYLYKETSTEENLEIEVQKICDAEVDEFIDDFQYVQTTMNTICYQPSSKSIKNILEYSKNKHLQSA